MILRYKHNIGYVQNREKKEQTLEEHADCVHVQISLGYPEFICLKVI